VSLPSRYLDIKLTLRPGCDRNFNADGFDSLYPKYKGGRPPKFSVAQRREIKEVAKARRH
jgi:transposase